MHVADTEHAALKNAATGRREIIRAADNIAAWGSVVATVNAYRDPGVH